jgi:exodeoxyribonuclease-3
MIATFNVNGVNGRSLLIRWLAKPSRHRPLAGMKTQDEKFPERAIRSRLSRVWHGQKSWNGVASARDRR